MASPNETNNNNNGGDSGQPFLSWGTHLFGQETDCPEYLVTHPLLEPSDHLSQSIKPELLSPSIHTQFAFDNQSSIFPPDMTLANTDPLARQPITPLQLPIKRQRTQASPSADPFGFGIRGTPTPAPIPTSFLAYSTFNSSPTGGMFVQPSLASLNVQEISSLQLQTASSPSPQIFNNIPVTSNAFSPLSNTVTPSSSRPSATPSPASSPASSPTTTPSVQHALQKYEVIAQPQQSSQSASSSPSSSGMVALCSGNRAKQTNYWDKIEEISRLGISCISSEEHRGKPLVQLQRLYNSSDVLTILNIDETWQHFALNYEIDWSQLNDKERQAKINNIRKSVLRALQKKNFQTIQHSAYGKGSFSVFRRQNPSQTLVDGLSPSFWDSAISSNNQQQQQQQQQSTVHSLEREKQSGFVATPSSPPPSFPSLEGRLCRPRQTTTAFPDMKGLSATCSDNENDDNNSDGFLSPFDAILSLCKQQSSKTTMLTAALQNPQLCQLSTVDLINCISSLSQQIDNGQMLITSHLQSLQPLIDRIFCALSPRLGSFPLPLIELIEPTSAVHDSLPLCVTLKIVNEAPFWGCPNLVVNISKNDNEQTSVERIATTLSYLSGSFCDPAIVVSPSWINICPSPGEYINFQIEYYDMVTNSVPLLIAAAQQDEPTQLEPFL